MRAFACPNCHSLVFFANTTCLTCSTPLGYLRPQRVLVAMTAVPQWQRCANLARAQCNRLAEAVTWGGLCSCCQLTRTRPSDDDERALIAFARTEQAKRRLMFELAR